MQNNTTTAPLIQADRILIHGYVITMDPSRRILRDGAVAIHGGKILAVGATEELLKKYTGSIYDCGGGVVHPGLIDAHEHLCLHLCRGWEPDRFSIEDTWNKFEALAYPNVTREVEALSVELATAEMLRNGTTAFSDTGSAFFPELSIAAAEKSGIRGFIARIGGDAFQPELSFLNHSTEDLLSLMEENLEKFSSGRIRAGAQLCGMGECSDALVVKAKALANRYGTPLFMHQCTYPHEVAAYLDSYGETPVQHLWKLGILDSNTTLVHMIHLTDRDLDILAETGTNVVHCPGASMKFGLGAFSQGKFPELLERGVNIALGTDSGTWCDGLDILQQVYLAAVGHREARREKCAFNSCTAFEAATLGGAKALGLEKEIGSLEAGKRADIVIHNRSLPECCPGVDPFMDLVFSARSKSVDTVLVEGEPVLLHGKLTRVDEEALYARAEKAAFGFRNAIGFEVSSPWPIE